MKVKILEGLAGANFSYSPGQVVDISDDMAKSFIKGGVAEPVKEVREKAVIAEKKQTRGKK